MLDHFRLEKSGSPFDAIRQLRADGEEFRSGASILLQHLIGVLAARLLRALCQPGLKGTRS